MTDDWTEEEAENIKDADKDQFQRVKRSEEVASAMREHWPVLKGILQNDIKRINASDEIQKKIGGKIEFSGQEYGQYKISKIIYPAIYLVIDWKNGVIEIDKQL